MRRLAREARDAAVRREAVETLGRVDGRAARAALDSIAACHPDPDARMEARDQLDRFRSR